MSHLLRRSAAALGCAALLVTCALSAGCGDGSGRVELSGTVTFNGQPVPAGKIYFSPDPAKGNKGPQGYADIKDGKFDTARTGKGGVTGPVIVHIEGLSAGDQPQPLFAAYEVPADLSGKSSGLTYDVPAAQAMRLPRNQGPMP
jgi:hypothetical protein